MPKNLSPLLFPLICSLFLNCASKKVLVPPRMPLEPLGRIGIVAFSSDSKGALADLCTQRFIQTIQRAQPGVMILELGRDQAAGGIEELKKLKKEYNLDFVFSGNLDVSRVKPSVNISSLLSSMSVSAIVNATLHVRLRETESGATMWNRSATREESVAHVGYQRGGSFSFDAKDPEKTYGSLVNKMVSSISGDFFSRYVKERR